jgi:Uri superfamily endonuclease
MGKGVYALVFSNRPCTLPVGGLGEIRFRRGWHVYIGSALGPGGFARVKRHLHLSREKDRSPRWHVDYLLISPFFTLRHIVCGPAERDLECALAAALGGEMIPSFGSGDCSCMSHLFHRPADPLDEIMDTMVSLGLVPAGTTLISQDLPSVGLSNVFST